MLPVKFYESLEAVIYIAQNSGVGAVSSKAISASQGKLPRYLEPFLQLLVHNGILKATKGPKGGYTLAREKRKITAGEIFRIFSEEKQSESPLGKKIILPLRNQAEKHIFDFFDKITIEDLCAESNSGEERTESGYFNI